ncbi:MAG: CDP-glucose 4,6-dehydratase [Terriglobales bacterium]
MMPNREYWNGRRVFLTGHTGFKGSWLSLWLNLLGADVTGYALAPPTQPNLFELANLARIVRSICADIRDLDRLKAAIAECRPDVIIHMAAQTVVGRGYEDPVETYSSNVMGTVHLFEAVRQLKMPCVVVNVTSDKCYDNREWVWGYRENDALGGHDPYSNSKGCAELVTSAYRSSYFPAESVEQHGVAIASARAGNVVGGGDWTANQLVPDLMRSFLAGRPCLIRNPSATRPWQFVLEPLRGYLVLAERLAVAPARFAAAWNFGPSDEDAKPVSWIADELARLWGKQATWVRDTAHHPHEAYMLKLDASKAHADLHWYPALPLSRALDWIVTWYRAFEAGEDLGKLCGAQIEQYEALSGSTRQTKSTRPENGSPQVTYNRATGHG